jgi:hypothetical protein
MVYVCYVLYSVLLAPTAYTYLFTGICGVQILYTLYITLNWHQMLPLKDVFTLWRWLRTIPLDSNAVLLYLLERGGDTVQSRYHFIIIYN